jgi:hypothetical protein
VTARPAVVDLVAVVASRERLKALTEAHPELCGPRGAANVDGWEDLLKEDEEHMAKTEQVAIRMEEELLARIDAHVGVMGEQMPGASFTRADAMRALILKGLGASEPAKGAAGSRAGKPTRR